MSTPWPIVFMGTPQTAALTLEQIIQGPDPVVGVVTQPDRPAGRGQKQAPSPVRKTAESHHISVVAPEKVRDPAFLDTLRKWNPKLIVVVAYGRILPQSILDLAPYGCLNVHYSLLPKYRGAAPAAWTIINGDTKAGVTTMKLVAKMDAGPIYLQEKIDVTPGETTGSLQTKLTPIGARLLLKTVLGLKDGSLAPREQDATAMTLAPLIKKEDGLIDWSQPAIVIERRVRGFNPWPSAYTYLAGKLLKIHGATVIDGAPTANPGEILRADSRGFWVATGAGAIALEEVQLENKKRLPGIEFIKGARVKTGDRV